ncbi:MAG: hypothetical protein ACFFD2_00655 [Promethearchaeota archaeon]
MERIYYNIQAFDKREIPENKEKLYRLLKFQSNYFYSKGGM